MRISSLTTAILLHAALCGCATSPVPVTAHSTGLSERLARGPRPLVVAHRGDSDAFPENTLPAFRSAVERRADLVELDFRQTADGAAARPCCWPPPSWPASSPRRPDACARPGDSSRGRCPRGPRQGPRAPAPR